VLTIASIGSAGARRLRARTVRAACAVGTAATLFGAVACAGDSGTGDDEVAVIGSFYPMSWVAQRVAGSATSVTTLTKPGAEPHDLELTPRQIVEVARADLIVYIKGLQPAVDQAIDEHAKDKAVDAASLVRALPATGETNAVAHGDSGSGDSGSRIGGSERGERDPHLWLDPNRLATVATTVADRLAASDPGHAATYRANARALGADLHALDGAFATGLRSCRQKVIVTSHAAFAYLADRYGLTQISVAGIDPQSEPSPARLAALTGEIRRTGASTVFTETLVSPKVAQTLAREAGVRTATLDPVEGLPAGSKGDYLSIMRQNLQTLRTALRCS
jgi:zinc transport system substrate-binding protein